MEYYIETLPLIVYVLQVMTCYFWGGCPKIIHTPPQNILEGNGVLYRNFTLNSLVLQVMTCYFWGVQKNNSYTPPNILEGNGVLYRNFTLNSLVLQVMTCYFWGVQKIIQTPPQIFLKVMEYYIETLPLIV